jgi:hypothetical protein
MIATTIRKFLNQANTLATNYGRVAAEYTGNDALTGVSQIAALQTALAQSANYQYTNTGNTGTNIDPLTRFDAVINAIFANDATAKTQFNKELDAYKKGLYLQQKQRFNGEYTQGGNSSDPKWIDLFNNGSNSLAVALTEAGVGTLPGTWTYLEQNMRMNTGSIGTDTVDYMVATLKAAMLTKLNAAMGVNDMDVSTENGAANKTKINALNGDFLTQMGDFAELDAMLDDNLDLGYDLQENWQYFSSTITNPTPIAMAAPQKAGTFNSKAYA